jgi:hypothetical protein
MAGVRWLAATALFGVLVTLNSGGYRYGAADQAFYVPAVTRHLSPAAFPSDRVLIDPQAAFTVWDEGMAWLSRGTGLDLSVLFFGGYVLTVALFALGLLRIGDRVYASPLATLSLLAALSLRHRIAHTGVNTFEGYFHPRVLAFAVGLTAIGATWAGRWGLAAVLLLAAAVAHPTTALWFGVWVGAAALATHRSRRVLAALGLAAAALAALALWRVGPSAMTAVMDADWTATFAHKDYVFPTEWRASTWAINLLSPLLLACLALLRARRGAMSARERGIVVGAFALLAVFFLSLPLVHARVALAVQMQTSRVFWALELMATVYVVWWLADARWSRPAWPPAVRAIAVAAVLSAAALARGAWVTFVEHPGRPVVQLSLPEGPWRDVTRWAATHTPLDAGFLVDPGHSWKYGLSFRVAAGRDVYLEEDKDTAIAFYSRDVAVRVRERIDALPDYARLTPATARVIAARFALDYVVTDRAMNLTEAYRNERFFVYEAGTGLSRRD